MYYHECPTCKSATPYKSKIKVKVDKERLKLNKVSKKQYEIQKQEYDNQCKLNTELEEKYRDEYKQVRGGYFGWFSGESKYYNFEDFMSDKHPNEGYTELHYWHYPISMLFISSPTKYIECKVCKRRHYFY